MSTPEHAFEFIDTPEQLQAFCTRIAGSPWLTLDTEFIREKTYYPQLCLLQVANAEHVACIDPLKLESLQPLLDLLYQPETVKVLHAAHQDLEILYHLTGDLPASVFDTQIAAALLGLGEQTGYANLIDSLLGIKLDKGQARTDWSLRPLQDEQLQYAANDVTYLRDAYALLLQKLGELDRLSWLESDFDRLSEASRYQNEPMEMWRKIKDGRRLKGRQLAVLQELAAWREEQAMQINRPRRWFLKDEVLAELARAMPDNPRSLSRIRGLEDNAIKRHGDKLLQLIARGKERPRAEWPELPQIRRLQPGQDAIVDAMMAMVRLCAAEAGLSPGMLASKKDLEQLLLDGPDSAAVCQGWRQRIAGKHLTAFLDGDSQLTVRDGRLEAVSGT